jgi:hypothetical protein
MPWWAVIYLIAFVAVSIFSDALAESDGTSRLRWLADLLTAAVFAVLFVGFWVSAIYRSLGLAGPVLLLGAVAWEVYSGPQDLRAMWRDPELSQKERVGLTLVAPLVMWPLFITAGVGVFRFYAGR